MKSVSKITVAEAARRLGMSRPALAKWVDPEAGIVRLMDPRSVSAEEMALLGMVAEERAAGESFQAIRVQLAKVKVRIEMEERNEMIEAIDDELKDGEADAIEFQWTGGGAGELIAIVESAGGRVASAKRVREGRWHVTAVVDALSDGEELRAVADSLRDTEGVTLLRVAALPKHRAMTLAEHYARERDLKASAPFESARRAARAKDDAEFAAFQRRGRATEATSPPDALPSARELLEGAGELTYQEGFTLAVQKLQAAGYDVPSAWRLAREQNPMLATLAAAAAKTGTPAFERDAKILSARAAILKPAVTASERAREAEAADVMKAIDAAAKKFVTATLPLERARFKALAADAKLKARYEAAFDPAMRRKGGDK
jgi:hypothetical protein